MLSTCTPTAGLPSVKACLLVATSAGANAAPPLRPPFCAVKSGAAQKPARKHKLVPQTRSLDDICFKAAHRSYSIDTQTASSSPIAEIVIVNNSMNIEVF